MSDPKIILEKVRVKLNKTELIINTEGVIVHQGTRSMGVIYEDITSEKENNLWELLCAISYHINEYAEADNTGAITVGRGAFIAEFRFAKGVLTYGKIRKKKEENIFIEFVDKQEVYDFMRCIIQINKMKKEN